MSWIHGFLAVSTLGHAALLGGVALLPKAGGTSAQPLTELFMIAAPEVIEDPPPPAPAEPEAPEPVVRRAPSLPAPEPEAKPSPPAEQPAPEQPASAEAASDNPYDAPEMVTANADTSTSAAFSMRSGHGNTLNPQRVLPRPAVRPQTPPSPQVNVTLLFKNWRARVGGLVMSAAGRRYPDSARRLGNEGTVVLSMTVDVLGRVTSVTIVRSSGHDDLDQAAISTVRGLGAVPPPPPELHASLHPFAVPIAYRLQ